MIRTAPKLFDVPRAAGSFGPFAAPAAKRTISPDDLQLFRLLCGFAGVTPGRMFRKLVREEARRQIGVGRVSASAKADAVAEANRAFAAATPRFVRPAPQPPTTVVAGNVPPVRCVPRYPTGVAEAALHGATVPKTGDQS